MQKILYLITRSEMGGAQRYVFDLATNIPKSQYEVHVAAGGDGILFSNLEQRGIAAHKLFHLKRSINPLADYRAYKEIISLIESLKPDIIHLNSTKAGVLGSKAARRANVKKIIHTAHGFVFNEQLSFYRKAIYTALERASAKRMTRIITVSEFDRATGIAAGIPEEKMIVIHNGIDPRIAFLPKKEAQEQLFASIPRFLNTSTSLIVSIANHYRTKGLDILIRTMDHVDAHLIVIGDGPEREQLRSLAKKHGRGRVHFIGSVDSASKYLKAFDLFVLPSRKEGLPYTLLEAQAAGIPIVATTVGGIPELIRDGENGYLAKPNDPGALAEIIKQALTRPLPSALENEYTLPRMMERTIAIYNT